MTKTNKLEEMYITIRSHLIIFITSTNLMIFILIAQKII